jgi:hypothetical protein
MSAAKDRKGRKLHSHCAGRTRGDLCAAIRSGSGVCAPVCAASRASVDFGVDFAVGSWLNCDCDWPRRRVCVGDWNPGWKHKWKRNRGGNYDVSNTVSVVNIDSDTARFWQPNAKRQQWKSQRSYNDFDAKNTTPFYSEANKHSQSTRIKKSKGGGSQNSGASYSKPKKSQSAGSSKGSGGGGHKSGKKGKGNKGKK